MTGHNLHRQVQLRSPQVLPKRQPRVRVDSFEGGLCLHPRGYGRRWFLRGGAPGRPAGSGSIQLRRTSEGEGAAGTLEEPPAETKKPQLVQLAFEPNRGSRELRAQSERSGIVALNASIFFKVRNCQKQC